MTSGGYDPNKDPQEPGSYPQGQGNYPPPEGGNPPPPGSYPPPSQGNYPPPQGSYPPPSQGSYPPPQGSYPPPGNYPPPQGSYPPPPQGSYPPPGFPQQGGYPTPPPFGYGPPNPFSSGQTPAGFNEGMNTTGYLLMDSVKFAASRLKDNPVVWVGFVFAGAIVSILFFVVLSTALFSAAMSGSGSLTFMALAIFVFILVAYSLMVNAAMIQGSLLEVDGKKAQFGDFFKIQNIGPAIFTSLTVGALTGIGFALLYIPGIIVGFLTSLALQFSVDRGTVAVESIKHSYKVVTGNIVEVFILLVGLSVLNFIGFVPLGLGLLITVPITIIATTFSYRRLAGVPDGT